MRSATVYKAHVHHSTVVVGVANSPHDQRPVTSLSVPVAPPSTLIAHAQSTSHQRADRIQRQKLPAHSAPHNIRGTSLGRPLHRRTGPSALRPPSPEHGTDGSPEYCSHRQALRTSADAPQGAPGRADNAAAADRTLTTPVVVYRWRGHHAAPRTSAFLPFHSSAIERTLKNVSYGTADEVEFFIQDRKFSKPLSEKGSR